MDTNGHIFLYLGTQVLINSIDAVTNGPYLQTISNVEVPALPVITIPTWNLVYVHQTHYIYMKYKLMRDWQSKLLNLFVTNKTPKKEGEVDWMLVAQIHLSNDSIQLTKQTSIGLFNYISTNMKTKTLLTWK